MKKVVTSIILLSLVFLSLPAVPTATAKPLTNVRVAYFDSAASFNLLIEIARKRGYFQKNGIKIEKVVTNKATTPLLIGKQADVSIGPIASIMSSYLSNIDTRWLGTTSTYNPTFHAVSKYSKKKISSVKKVGLVTMAGADRILMDIALEKLGVDLNSVQYVVAPEEPARTAMLETGAIDIAFINLHLNRNRLKKKGFNIYKPRTLFSGYFTPDGIHSTKYALEQNPKGIKGFVKGIFLALRYTKTHPKATKAFLKSRWGKKYGITKAVAANFYAEIIASRKRTTYIPGGDTTRLYNSVKKISKPKNPNRDQTDFVFKDYAKLAIKQKGGK